MIRFLFIFGLFFVTTAGWTQNTLKKNWYRGNSSYNNAEYEDAISHYEKAVEHSPMNYKVNFNLGNAFFRFEAYDKAIEQFEKIIELAPTPNEKANTYHNLGNTFMATQKYDDAIEAYKNALRLAPYAEDTRYNLAYAQLMKKEQEKNQEQQDQDKDQKDQDKDQDQKDQDQKDQDQKDKDQKDQDQKDNDQKDQGNDGNDKDKDKDKDENEQVGNNPQNLPPISKEQAKRILEAASRKEKEVQEKLDKEKIIGTGTSGKIDW